MRKIAILCFLGLWSLSTPSLLAKQNPAELDLGSGEKFAQEKDTLSEEKEELAKEAAADAIPYKPGIAGFFQRMNEGTKKFFDNTLKGTYRVATLGQSELQSYEIQEPEKGSDEPTKIKISLPGT